MARFNGSYNRHFNHDPVYFSNPMEFMPERFIDAGSVLRGFDPYDTAFGFGRRSVIV